MPRTNINISLPPAMAREVEAVRKEEHRTRSELVREALRTYFATRAYKPTPRELRAIEAGRAAHRRGDYYSLDAFKAWLLGSQNQEARAKKPAVRSAARARAARRRAG